MEIKICGITNMEDAFAAAHCGADALGFIFFRNSPRYVSPEAAKAIIADLPEEIIRVGVFVNMDAGEVDGIREFCGLDLIQLHGDETPDYCRLFPPEVLIKAVSPRSEADLRLLAAYPVRALLADYRAGSRYGGTGMPADWPLAAKMAKMRPLVLAGGLSTETVGPAIAAVAPLAVDINSGVERAPGEKDPEKMKAIVRIVRRAAPAGQQRGRRIFDGHRRQYSPGKGGNL